MGKATLKIDPALILVIISKSRQKSLDYVCSVMEILLIYPVDYSDANFSAFDIIWATGTL